jgi:hypothetical protein
MAQILDDDDQQRLRDWILELFFPVRGPTRHGEDRRGAEEVRFGLGEFDLPGMLFSHLAVIRGLVWAFLKVAPKPWSELTALVQEALDGMCTQWVSREEPDRWVIPEEPDRRDQLLLAYAAIRSQKAYLSLELLGLRAEDEEIRAAAPERQLLIVPNLPALQEWRARWNLADDRSLFTQALVVEAIDEADLARQVSDDVMALIIFTLFFDLERPAIGITSVAGSWVYRASGSDCAHAE